MDSLSQPSWVLGFGSVRFVRSSFPVDMDGAEGKRYIFRCIYIYIYFPFSQQQNRGLIYLSMGRSR